MSGAWEGGKGDKSRITDYKTYGENHDKIFNKKERTIHKKSYLILDDIRYPKECVVVSETSREKLLDLTGTFECDWKIVRTLKDFFNFIDDNGVPDVISFDNDLDLMDYQRYADVKNGKGSYDYETDMGNGIEAFRYIVNYCNRTGVKFPKVYAHTANEFARKIINDKLKELVG